MVLRQLLAFGVVGALQVLLDWGCFVALTFAGAAVVPANVAGRVAGASLGFWLNGRVTFAGAGAPRLAGRPLVRFLVFWSATTVVSTLAVHAIDAEKGLGLAWLLKPAVEALLAVAGFLAGKYWIYR